VTEETGELRSPWQAECLPHLEWQNLLVGQAIVPVSDTRRISQASLRDACGHEAGGISANCVSGLLDGGLKGRLQATNGQSRAGTNFLG